MLKNPSDPKVAQAERKIGAVLEDLEDKTSSEVKDVDLEQVVDDDPKTGEPVIRDAVEIDVETRTRRSWLK